VGSEKIRHLLLFLLDLWFDVKLFSDRFLICCRSQRACCRYEGQGLDFDDVGRVDGRCLGFGDDWGVLDS
jgi:hypothetical protein